MPAQLLKLSSARTIRLLVRIHREATAETRDWFYADRQIRRSSCCDIFYDPAPVQGLRAEDGCPS